MISSSFTINNVVASIPNVFDPQPAPTTGLGRSTVSQNASSRLQTGWFEVVFGPDEGELDITQALGDTIAHRQSPIDASTTVRHYLDTAQDEELDLIEFAQDEVDIAQPRPTTTSASPEVFYPPTSPLATLDELDKELMSWESCLAIAEAMGDDLSLPPSPASILPSSSDSSTTQDPESYDESLLFPDECTTTVAVSYDDLFREELDPEEEYQEDPTAIAAQGEDINAPTSNWFRPASSPEEATHLTKMHVSILQDRREERGIVSIRIMNYQAAKALDLPASAFDLPADVVMRRERAPISKMGRGSPLWEFVTAEYFESCDEVDELEEGEIREEISRSSSASSLSAYSTRSGSTDLQGQDAPWSSPDTTPSSSPELECATLPPRPSTPLPFVRSTSSPYHTPAPTPQPSPALSEWALDDDDDELPSLDCWAPTPSRHDHNENKDHDLSLGLSINSVAPVPSTNGIF